jgi:hypothetical protein
MATTFTVGTGDIIRPWKNVRIQHFPEDASQTFLRGAVLIAGGAGVENRCKTAADNPTAAILGIAAADASGVTGTMIPVFLATNDAEFIGRAISTATADFTDIGRLAAVKVESTKWVVNVDDNGNDSVVVLQYLNPITRNVQATEGDTNALCVFKFVPAATIWSGTV